jgi:hypothetical protein
MNAILLIANYVHILTACFQNTLEVSTFVLKAMKIAVRTWVRPAGGVAACIES